MEAAYIQGKKKAHLLQDLEIPLTCIFEVPVVATPFHFHASCH